MIRGDDPRKNVEMRLVCVVWVVGSQEQSVGGGETVQIHKQGYNPLLLLKTQAYCCTTTNTLILFKLGGGVRQRERERT